MITVNDDLSKTEAVREAAFEVRGHVVEPSETLVIRNFRFLRGDDDSAKADPPSYRPGDAIWAHFDITGYKLEAKNLYHISYGVEVVRIKSMYSQPEAANEREETFYRKRYVPGTFSLQLTPNLAKTGYTVVIRVRDQLGQQEFETRHTFHVE